MASLMDGAKIPIRRTEWDKYASNAMYLPSNLEPKSYECLAKSPNCYSFKKQKILPSLICFFVRNTNSVLKTEKKPVIVLHHFFFSYFLSLHKHIVRHFIVFKWSEINTKQTEKQSNSKEINIPDTIRFSLNFFNIKYMMCFCFRLLFLWYFLLFYCCCYLSLLILKLTLCLTTRYRRKQTKSVRIRPKEPSSACYTHTLTQTTT